MSQEISSGGELGTVAPVELNMLRTASIEVVFKIQETCNINCEYCYMYNLGNDAYLSMPQQASLEICEGVAEFVCKEFDRRVPNYAHIIIHGGEPMLMKAAQMDRRLMAMDAHFRERLQSVSLSS